MFHKRLLIVMLFCTSFLIFNVRSVNSIGPEIALSDTRPVRMVKCSTYEPRFNKHFNDFEIIIDDRDQIYIGGHFMHDLYDSILLGTDLKGELLWENLSNKGKVYDIALDSNGYLYCTGIQYVDDSSPDIFLWKFSNSGSFIWQKLINGFGSEWGRAISTDSLNNIYVAGYNYSNGMIAAKYSPNGEREWLIDWGNELNAVCFDCAIDSSDNLYLVGFIDEFLGSDMCIVKFDSLGEELWNLTFPYIKGVYTEERLFLVENDDEDNILVVGDIHNRACYAAKFSSNGINIWNVTWVIDNKVLGVSDFVIDSKDNIFILGGYRPYESSDSRYDNQLYNYLIKLENGKEKWRYYWKFSEYDFIGGMALKNGKIYICGSSDGTLYLANFSESNPIFVLYTLFSWVGGALAIFVIIDLISKKKNLEIYKKHYSI